MEEKEQKSGQAIPFEASDIEFAHIISTFRWKEMELVILPQLVTREAMKNIVELGHVVLNFYHRKRNGLWRIIRSQPHQPQHC